MHPSSTETYTLSLHDALPICDLRPLFEEIVRTIPPPRGAEYAPLQMLVANLDYNDYVGRLAIGRIFNGSVAVGDQIAVVGVDGQLRKTKVTQLYSFEGLKQTPIETATAGEIVALAGMEGVNIGDTMTSAAEPRPLARISVDK